MGNESRKSNETRTTGMATRSKGSSLKRQRSSEDEVLTHFGGKDNENLNDKESKNKTIDNEDANFKKRVRFDSKGEDTNVENTIAEDTKVETTKVQVNKLVDESYNEDTSSFVVANPFRNCSCPKNVMRCIGILPAAPYVLSMNDSDSEDDDYIISGIIPQVDRKSGSHD